MKAIMGNVILKDSVLEDGVVIFNNKILQVMTKEQFHVYEKNNSELEIINAKGKYLSPGFIDVHIHGCGGYDAMDGTEEAIKNIGWEISKRGVTSFLPTTMTMSFEQIYIALEAIRKCIGIKYKGATVLGVHMEGPFISKEFKGAQNAEFIKSPNIDYIKDYLDIIKIITYAPETDLGNEFLNSIKDNSNIILSIGHSNATYEEAMEAVNKGVNHFTHTFNAMSPMHHRKPGVVGAALKSRAYIELICDTIHVHPGLYDVLVKVKGNEKMLLITDCMRAGCMCHGEYDLGGQKVIVKDNSARLEDGTLAGSILTLNEAVMNMYRNTELSLNEVVNMVSLNQAVELGIDHMKGSIDVGKDADITVFDEKFNIYRTIVEGRTVYQGGEGFENNNNR